MKLTLITAGLFAVFSIPTAGASPHNRPRGPSELGIDRRGGTVNGNDGTGISNSPEDLYVPVVSTPTSATTTTTPTLTATPIAIKREVHHLGGGHRGRGKVGAHSEEEEEVEVEVDMLVARLNHSFDHEHLRIGGECSLRQKKGCAGNSLVECGSEGVWELVADCDVPGLDLVCQAVRERDIWKGGWVVNVICLEK
ncbi:hypothetical protein C7212DRAFT_351247 [Tuber magnatum]|uniref:SRCR domain-containing protein n=1 Tax=Tuber magnatum TaxID=42249 RepID=A0A317SVN4_9PEZI|nr:hypothetical protein C7212DRAFT_351247 [Tuber magnatum]